MAAIVPIKTNLANPRNYGGKRSESSITYIVVHYTANDGDHDESNANYFKNPLDPVASAHYFVDDDSITLSVPELSIAYSCGDKLWSNVAQTGGGKYHGRVTNSNSINIEMCDTVRDGKYNLSAQTRKNTIDLIVMLMAKYRIDIDHVLRHFDVSGKSCPSYFVAENEWRKFKEEITMTFGEYCLNAINEYLQSQPVPKWAEPELERAKAKGLTDGSGLMKLDPFYRPLIVTLRALERAEKK